MLSVVVIGRNDSHGYNLNKRVATSLNNIAYCLNNEDEIIFVDWNTTKEYPVLPVAISDDLNSKTKNILRVIRITEDIHNYVSKDSSRKVIEPIARNVGLRRTNPNNKWVLSTNTDMIFLLEEGGLNKLVENLGEDLWLGFRNEIPEYLWESFDKRDPVRTIAELKKIHEEFDFVNKITISPLGSTGPCLTDGVGDFQLATRDDWFGIGGFCESMLYGWHVDTRASLKFRTKLDRRVSILNDKQLIAFHQNHSRTPTGYHGLDKINDELDALKGYENSLNWGLSELPIKVQEFKESNEFQFENLLIKKSAKSNSITPLENIHLNTEYSPSRVMNFLRDILIVLPPRAIVLSSVHEDLARLIEIDCNSFHLDLVKSRWNLDTGIDVADCIIVDLGIPVAAQFGEPNTKLPLGNLKNLQKLYQSTAKSDATYVFVRAQNWATRKLVRLFFNTQLFNNYSSILYGRKRKSDSMEFLRILQGRVLLFFASQDYILTPTGSKKLTQRLRKLPASTKRRLIRWSLRFLGI